MVRCCSAVLLRTRRRERLQRRGLTAAAAATDRDRFHRASKNAPPPAADMARRGEAHLHPCRAAGRLAAAARLTYLDRLVSVGANDHAFPTSASVTTADICSRRRATPPPTAHASDTLAATSVAASERSSPGAEPPHCQTDVPTAAKSPSIKLHLKQRAMRISSVERDKPSSKNAEDRTPTDSMRMLHDCEERAKSDCCSEKNGQQANQIVLGATLCRVQFGEPPVRCR